MSLKKNIREIMSLLLGIVVSAVLIVSVNRSNRLINLETGFVKKQEKIKNEISDMNTSGENTVSKTYYYDPGTHDMVKGDREIDGNWYYFDRDTGVMLTGFCELDVNGELLALDKTWDEAILSENDELGIYGENSIEVQKNRSIYYYDETGKRVFGEKKIGENWYMFDPETGKMVVGFYEYSEPDSQGNKKERYYNEYGHRMEGLNYIDGDWYYFENGSGKMKTGFKYFEDKDCIVCFSKEGKMLFGEHFINGYRYKFDEETGEKISRKKLM